MRESPHAGETPRSQLQSQRKANESCCGAVCEPPGGLPLHGLLLEAEAFPGPSETCPSAGWPVGKMLGLDYSVNGLVVTLMILLMVVMMILALQVLIHLVPTTTPRGTTGPICAKDICDSLMKELAFLSGGRGKNNDYIITFPENSSFKEVPEDVFKKVLTYLTSLARKRVPDTKFIIILDRRLDTWASVKISLQRIAASFPGNLHLVMVLRPTSFIQRTFTDIGFRFSQDDFILKLPVVMLSSVSDLLNYIDEKQLTPEFGGTLEYCHSEWVIFRTAIENFALTVKEIAQILQSFGTELAETELPDDAYSIERLLKIRTEKYLQLKEQIKTVTKEGNVLLKTFEVPKTKDSKKESSQEQSGDWETIQRLLAQLHDMEAAFDEFWDKHQLKMDQFVQLWRFEQNFLELKGAVEFLMEQQAAIPSTGENVADVRQKLTELATLDEMSKELIGKAHLMILQGHQLAANHHYAVELICQRCNELRHQMDVLSEELKAKEKKLSKTLELQNRLRQALLCCDEGAYLLANQPMDKCQAKEGAQRALYDIEKFLDVTLPNLKYDPRVLQREFEVILTPELKAQIQAVQVKLESIRSMFQNRQTCFRKLTDKHSRPIQLVAPRPELTGRSKSPLFSPRHGMDFNSSLKFSFDLSLPGKKSRKNQNSRKIEVMHDYQEKRNSLQYFISENDDSLHVLKRHVINELIETERVYVEELFIVLVGYRAEMENPEMIPLMPMSLRTRKDILFGNMPEIYEFHKRIFLHSLESCLEAPQRVGFCFLERRNDFQIYEKYCQNKPRSELLWRQHSESVFFMECQKKLDHKLGLDSYLLKPVQRLTKYQLLLKELLKYSASCEGVHELQEALEAMLDLLKSVNDSMHQTAITGYDGDLSDLGKILMQGSFSVWISHRKGATKMKDFARFKPMQRHLFLYEKAIVFCKRRNEHGDGHEKTPFYSFKHHLKMNAVGITENVKGDSRKFEIWYSGREEVYVLQAQTMESKTAWLNEIRKILIKQQEVERVENQQRNQAAEAVPSVSQLTEGMQQRVSISSEENESDRTSPGTADNLTLSSQPKTRKSSSGTSLTAELKDNLEEWVNSSFLLACSDTEEEDGSQLSPRNCKVLSGCKKKEWNHQLVKIGDARSLLHENGGAEGSVKNPYRRKEVVNPGNSSQSVIWHSRARKAKAKEN
ncbi:proto-oncogene DBL isoform X1 [Sarcophilus harrisii]|uniref:MCF.2 cell line derived transforming sequence n=1 Tax=Sarcophilus harrisii TaxID=9305 RepID=G3W666_SARHA|nr:proto-oncogene DBL isoform X1 [Sarcophilus harrisii]